MKSRMLAEFERMNRFEVSDDMDIQTSIAWENWQTAWNAALAQPRAPISDAMKLLQEAHDEIAYLHSKAMQRAGDTKNDGTNNSTCVKIRALLAAQGDAPDKKIAGLESELRQYKAVIKFSENYRFENIDFSGAQGDAPITCTAVPMRKIPADWPQLDPTNAAFAAIGWNECRDAVVKAQGDVPSDAKDEIFQWLLGENGDFPMRQDGDGAYWWRKELRKRIAAIAASTKER